MGYSDYYGDETKALYYKKNVSAKDIYINPKERDRLLEILQKKGKVENYRLRLRKKDGTVAVVNLNNRLVKKEDGKELLEGNISDITGQVKAEGERNRAEAALKREKEKSERLAKEAIEFSEMTKQRQQSAGLIFDNSL